MEELLKKRRLKEYNAGRILQELKMAEVVTKVELAQKLDVSFSTISTTCKSLEDSGFVLTEEGDVSTGGRIPNLIRVNPDAGHYVVYKFSNPLQSFGIEVLDFARREKASSMVPYDDVKSLEALIERIEIETRRLLHEIGVPWDRVLGTCMAIPGVFDRKRETTFTFEKQLINHVRLRDRLEATLKVAVEVENDANLIALGHAVHARGRFGNMLVVYFAHGIGLGILSDGKIYRGSTGYAGEVGHIRSVESGYLCSCGATGCLQTVATVRYMLKEYFGESYDMATILKSQEQLVPRFLRAVAEGDRTAVAIVERAGRSIGDAIGSLIDLFNPEAVGICGDVVERFVDIVEQVRMSALERSYIIEDNDTPILALSNQERLMTLGATEMVFLKWMASAKFTKEG